MRIRTFTAASMSEAMALVRREMGVDAIIISTRNNPRGNVEVRAAIEGGAASVADVVALVYEPLPPGVYPAAYASAAAQWEHLTGKAPQHPAW